MIVRFIRNFIVISLVLFIVTWFLPNVSFGFGVKDKFVFDQFITHSPVLFLTAFILTVLSTLARPVLELITAPINFFTLGLFNVIINVFFFYIATYLIPEFKISLLSIGGLQLNAFFSYTAVAIFFGFIEGVLALIF